MEEGEEVRLDEGVKEVLLVLFNHTVSVSLYCMNKTRDMSVSKSTVLECP